MKQVLMCKGCENLRTSSTYPSGRWCKIDGHLKGSQKEDEPNCWTQCSNKCPLKRYIIRGGKNATFKTMS